MVRAKVGLGPDDPEVAGQLRLGVVELLLLPGGPGPVGLLTLPGPGSRGSRLEPGVCVSSQSGTCKVTLLSAREAGGLPQ